MATAEVQRGAVDRTDDQTEAVHDRRLERGAGEYLVLSLKIIYIWIFWDFIGILLNLAQAWCNGTSKANVSCL